MISIATGNNVCSCIKQPWLAAILDFEIFDEKYVICS